MDIKTYVRDHIKVPTTLGSDNQFAILAFDLGVPRALGCPPPATPQFSDSISGNGESGPWCVQPHNYSPVASPVMDEAGKAVLVKKDKYGEDTVTAAAKEHYGPRETIHAERSLIARLPIYIAQYQNKHRRMPSSVSLYSHLSPCRHCIKTLQPFPKKTRIPHWFFAYSLPYVSSTGQASRSETDYYPDAKSAIDAAEALRPAGWHVL